MSTHPLRFLRQGQPVTLHDVPPDRTLLDLLRDDLGCTGTKEGCGEGDCGACTVVLGERVQTATGPQLRYAAINSCIRLAHSIAGMAVWTVEDLAQDPCIARSQSLHPVQESLAQCHGSQCGFCTPGFVMSLFGLYQQQVQQGGDGGVDRRTAQEALSGNLCRCTGYRPILDAAQHMGQLPPARVDEAQVLQKLEQIAQAASGQNPDLTYMQPTALAPLLAQRAAHPQAQVVAGCTDVGLWVTKQHRQFPQVLDVTRVAELRQVEVDDKASAQRLRIGAAVPLSQAFEALEARWPQLHSFLHRFAGLPVRNSGTLGGNVANGSPIGDSMPLLIALGAQVVLGSVRGERSLALEALYTGYRQNVMATDELLLYIDIPLPAAAPAPLLRAYKVSKRWDDDISAVCLALSVQVVDGVVQAASIGVGGVAATPVRARQAEAALVGQAWSQAAAQRAGQALQAEFSPISDMRASGAYRRQLLASLMQRFWLESQGHTAVQLEDFSLELALEASV